MKNILSLFLAIERDLIVGGQAVIEGVMMRTPSAYAIAVRKSDGSIVHTAEKLPKWSDKYKWLNLPVLRGGATLIQSMALGVKALNFSANIYEENLKTQEELAKPRRKLRCPKRQKLKANRNKPLERFFPSFSRLDLTFCCLSLPRFC
jgi:uncharacterized protein YqhQ